MTARIAPSVLSADIGRLGEQIDRAVAGGADWLHVDVMDGHFVPNLTFGAPMVRALRRLSDLPLDVHLMVERPERYLAEFADAGASVFTFHPEATVHIQRHLQPDSWGCRLDSPSIRPPRSACWRKCWMTWIWS
jgi:ribulose-phosphate 3-epimerase